MRRTAAALAVLLRSGLAVAQAAPAPIDPLDALDAETATVAEVPVEADRLGVELEPGVDPTASRRVFGPAEVARALRRGQDLAALVDGAAGARVLDLGGPGQPRRLRIRGASPAQSAVFVDGVRIGGPFATGVDLGLVPLSGAESVELQRGPAGAVLGEGVLGGALIVTSRPAERTPSVALGLRYGQLGVAELEAELAPGPLRISGGWARSDGAFDYRSAPIGLPPIDRHRENNDSTRAHLGARLDLPLAGGRIRVVTAAAGREAGVAGLETQADPDARERRGSALARVGWQRLGPRGRLELAVSGHALGIDYEDPDPIAPVRSTSRFYAGGAEASAELPLGARHLLRLDGALLVEQADSTEHGQPIRGRFGLGAADTWTDGPWTLFGALRAEAFTLLPAQLSPRLGARWEAGDWSLGAALGRGLRLPSFDELYHPSERGLVGNPGLSPESAWALEATASWQPSPELRLALTGFGRRLDDAILYVRRNAFEIRPENVGGAWVAGAELELSAEASLWGLGLDARGSATLVRSRLDATGVGLPGQPSLDLAAALGLAPPIGGGHPLRLGAELRVASATPANVQATLQVPAYLRLDLAAELALADGVFAALVLSNALDARDLETVQKLPLPGRWLLASVRVEAPR